MEEQKKLTLDDMVELEMMIRGYLEFCHLRLDECQVRRGAESWVSFWSEKIQKGNEMIERLRNMRTVTYTTYN